ncbi:hypothetical protein ACOMHN_035691 [Nucella lapillus]
MADAGTTTPTVTSREPETEDNMTCAICHEVYKTPKLLECTHTFCEPCLRDYVGAAHKFFCPMCRKEIRVPHGGVAGFRSNPYIRNEDLDKARKTYLCLEHAKKELELYCIDCDLPICVLCMMKSHMHHKMKTISEAATDVHEQLQSDQVRVQKAVDDVSKHVTEAKGKLEALQEKKNCVEKDVLNRHATMVTAANKLRDEALESLATVSGEIEDKLRSELQQIQDNLNHLLKLKKTLDDVVSEGVDYERATVAKDMRSGAGNPGAVLHKASQRISTVTRPVLRCAEADDCEVVKKMGEYLGEVVKLARRDSLAVLGKKSRRSVIMGKIASELV